MPESSSTEEAAITPDGNVRAASTRATIGVDATGIPSRMAGQLPLFHPSASRPESLGSRGEDEKGSPPTRGMIIDAHTRVDDNSVLSGRADLHPFMELLAERDTPLLIHGGQSIFVLPERAGRAALAGPAVADVIHLIAELAENATIFSPPDTPVRVHGDVVGRGYAVEIEDRGLGLSDEKLAEINQNFAHPPQLDLSGSEQLGLFVAGQLARRHDIQISLHGSPYGST